MSIMFAPAFAAFATNLRHVWLYSVQAVASAGEQTSLRKKKAEKAVEKNVPLNVIGSKNVNIQNQKNN